MLNHQSKTDVLVLPDPMCCLQGKAHAQNPSAEGRVAAGAGSRGAEERLRGPGRAGAAVGGWEVQC